MTARAGLLLLWLTALAGCAGSAVRSKTAATAEVIAAARENGAQRCAPVELAMAEFHNDFANHALDLGNYHEARREAAIAATNAQLAFEHSPKEKCAPKAAPPPPPPDPGPGDQDGDGLLDNVDECPNDPEDKDDFNDQDGCPEPDNDNDGLADTVEKCPLEPEDKDDPTPGGVCTGLGISPLRMSSVLGVVQAYTTRVGEGPFPTELLGEDGERLRKLGNEYGATTGRPRRCGWFDAPVVRRSIQLSGAANLAITKLDVLDTIPLILICTHYKINGKDVDLLPFDAGVGDFEIEPAYEDFRGWMRNTAGIENYDDLPRKAKSYLRRLEELVGAKIAPLDAQDMLHIIKHR